MSRKRALPFLKLSTSKIRDDKDTAMDSMETYQFAPWLSRESLSGSSVNSPITSNFSTRSHSRQPSSSSSIATSPDSPVNIAKSLLDDLLEDPAERDDLHGEAELAAASDEPLCICDHVACEHQQSSQARSSNPPPGSPEWLPGDDTASEGPSEAFWKRRGSDQRQEDTKRSRTSRRWPSISTRWRERKATTSLSSPTVASAPLSRSASDRHSSVRQSLASHLEPRSPISPLNDTYSPQSEGQIFRSSQFQAPAESLRIQIPEPMEDPIDRQELASTPLLPPAMHELQSRSEEDFESALQSPSIAAPSVTASVPGTPISSPAFTAATTPSLSTRPSLASIGLARNHYAIHSASELAPLSVNEKLDKWSHQLGHLNFHISPEPYLPDRCDFQSCNRLLGDWESARAEYLRHAAHISEHHGSTSRVHNLTEQKWAVIDAEWRSNLNRANAEAEAHGESPALQQLATTQPITTLPALNDPEHPEKFPTMIDGHIVGPMVQYAKVERKPSKKEGILKLFTGPSALLRRRAASSADR